MNPGIVTTVKWLNDHGFTTSDSGDGETHEFACDQPVPYVHMLIAPAAIASEADRLASLLKEEHGIVVQQMNEEGTTPVVEAGYNPADGGFATLTLWNVKL